jgi:hypothetical protein
MSEATLRNLASRTAVLARELPQYRAILDVLTGAVFALLRAGELKYKHRDGQLTAQYLQNLTLRLERMAQGRLPRKHGWLAGFYFNSAIQRIAAAGEQLEGILTRCEREAKRDGKQINGLAPLRSVRKVCDEVDRFKHDETGLERGRDVTPSLAIEALDEIIGKLEGHKAVMRGTGPHARKPRARIRMDR